MATIQQILDRKGRDILSVSPDDTVLDAIRRMAARNVGSVAVIEDGRLVGLFTERHYARNVFLEGRASPTTPVRDVMETDVACVRPQETVDEAMAIMTDKRVRHLPVVQRDELLGIVSIGDLVKSKIADQQFTIDRLVDYVHG